MKSRGFMTASLGHSDVPGPVRWPNWASKVAHQIQSGPAPLKHKYLKNFGKSARWFSWATWATNGTYPPHFSALDS